MHPFPGCETKGTFLRLVDYTIYCHIMQHEGEIMKSSEKIGNNANIIKLFVYNNKQKGKII